MKLKLFQSFSHKRNRGLMEWDSGLPSPPFHSVSQRHEFSTDLSVSELSDRLGLGGSNSDLMFNDTTRLRLNAKARSSLSNIFSHEAPSLSEAQARSAAAVAAASAAAAAAAASSRPKEPPPPPPPVAEVLKPMVPPKRSTLLFTQVMMVVNLSDLTLMHHPIFILIFHIIGINLISD